jgi:hypothetical protein
MHGAQLQRSPQLPRMRSMVKLSQRAISRCHVPAV